MASMELGRGYRLRRLVPRFWGIDLALQLSTKMSDLLLWLMVTRIVSRNSQMRMPSPTYEARWRVYPSPSQKLANSRQITSPTRPGCQNFQPAPAMRRYVPRSPISARKRPGDEQWRTGLYAGRRARAEERGLLGR